MKCVGSFDCFAELMKRSFLMIAYNQFAHWSQILLEMLIIYISYLNKFAHICKFTGKIVKYGRGSSDVFAHSEKKMTETSHFVSEKF